MSCTLETAGCVWTEQTIYQTHLEDIKTGDCKYGGKKEFIKQQ
jgi:hypothetical protein